MKAKVIICVHGGVVQEVKANCEVEVEVLDLDDLAAGEADAGLETEYENLSEVVY